MTKTVGAAPADRRGSTVVDPTLARQPTATPGALAAVMYSLALGWWASSWTLSSSVLMRWAPVDALVVGTVATMMCVVHRLGRVPMPTPSVLWPPLLLVAAYVPGAIASDTTGFGPTKIADMGLQVLPVTFAALLLLDDPRSRRSWCAAHVLVGAGVAAAAVMAGPDGVDAVSGRLSLPSVNTVSSARLVGGAAVVLVLVGIVRARRSWWAWLPAAACAVVLIQIGSRGPLLAVVLAIALAVISSGLLSGRRSLVLAWVSGATVAAFGYAVASGTSGGDRITESLGDGLSDDLRTRLLTDGLELGLAHPLGVGWGDFSLESRAGAELANGLGRAYPHNVFVETFAEGGLPALVATVTVVVVGLARLRRVSDDLTGVVTLALAIYWVLNAQVSSDVVGNGFMWVTLAAGWASRTDGRPPWRLLPASGSVEGAPRGARAGSVTGAGVPSSVDDR